MFHFLGGQNQRSENNKLAFARIKIVQRAVVGIISSIATIAHVYTLERTHFYIILVYESRPTTVIIS